MIKNREDEFETRKRPCNATMFLWVFGHRMLMGIMPNNIWQNKYNILRHMLTCDTVEHCVFILNGGKFKIKCHTRAHFYDETTFLSVSPSILIADVASFDKVNIFTVWPSCHLLERLRLYFHAMHEWKEFGFDHFPVLSQCVHRYPLLTFWLVVIQLV